MEQGSGAPGAPVTAEAFLAALRALVGAESPTADAAAVAACGATLARTGTGIVGVAPERVATAGGPDALAWRLGDPAASGRVLLLGHMDTVWPVGTAARRPLAVEDGRVTGPGVFDMKAGLVQGLFAMRALAPRGCPVTLLVTPDEETGSAVSRAVIEAEAGAAGAVLALEGAAPGGALKSARKGWSIYTLRLTGLAAHAGLEPDQGRNALVSLAGLVATVAGLADPERGLTVTPTTARAGETGNTVPARAELTLDVRAATALDQDRAHAAISALAGTDRHGVAIRVDGGVNRPPMERRAAAALLDRVAGCATRLGIGPPGATAVGGVSDANLTAALGVPTLDGLGAVGGGAHAEHEWIDLPATLERVALLTALVTDLTGDPPVVRPYEVRPDGPRPDGLRPDNARSDNARPDELRPDDVKPEDAGSE